MRENLVRVTSLSDERVDLVVVATDATGKASTYSGLPTSSMAVTNLDGTLWSNIDVNCRIKNKLDAVGMGSDRAAWYKYADSGSWTAWTSLGGSFITPLTMTSAMSNRADVFGTSSSHKIMHRSKTDGSSSTWAAWDTLDGHWHSSVAATRRSDGWIDIVAIDQGFEMCHKLWDSSNSRTWTSLGGRFKSPPVITACGSGRVDVFGLDFDNRILHKSGVGTGNAALVWTPAGKEWEDLGGDFDSPPAAVSCAAGRIDVVAIKTDGSVRINTCIDNVWYLGKEWLVIGTGATSAPVIVSRGTGKIDVICTFNTNNAVWIRPYSGDVWNDWVTTNAASTARRTYTGFPPYVPPI